ncbi:PAS domain-containing protein [Methylobacterium pseudosasicola]|uniref:PAS fold-containing protein n=1 Tax=Methylobacterium pseudosasicola TaxID=582667 RepID=A0A1I4JXI2_9HYPH|nr:PAS domain-containing protein [Methylobacterium pseudosasicola]SFL71279.1 PAS fold-containing protein [Methylobacterium pseudosasicola]
MALASTAASALEDAGFVGTWDTDVLAGRSVLDAGAAALLSGDSSLAGKPLPLDVALGRVHPEDRGWVFDRIRAVRRTGGPVSLEFRVLSETGHVRWILNRGRLAPDSLGSLRGRGAYIDVTDLYAGPSPSANGDASSQAKQLEAAADHCIRVHSALERYGNENLRLISSMLLLGIGRALALRD